MEQKPFWRQLSLAGWLAEIKINQKRNGYSHGAFFAFLLFARMSPKLNICQHEKERNVNETTDNLATTATMRTMRTTMIIIIICINCPLCAIFTTTVRVLETKLEIVVLSTVGEVVLETKPEDRVERPQWPQWPRPRAFKSFPFVLLVLLVAELRSIQFLIHDNRKARFNIHSRWFVGPSGSCRARRPASQADQTSKMAAGMRCESDDEDNQTGRAKAKNIQFSRCHQK